MGKLILSTNIRHTDAQWFRPTSIDNIVEMFNNAIAEHGPCQCGINGNTSSMDSIILSMLTFHEATHHSEIIKLYGDPPEEVRIITYSINGESVDGANVTITKSSALKSFLMELFKKLKSDTILASDYQHDLILLERQMVDRLIINVCTLSET